MMRRLLLLSLLVITMVGCVTVRADELPEPRNAPEDALFDWVQQQPPAVAHSLAIRQVVQLDERRAAILATFNPDGWSHPQPALTLFIAEQQGDRWAVRSYTEGASPVLVKDVLTYDRLDKGEHHVTFSAVYGLILNDRVTQLDIRWSDGSEQKVPVINGSYMALREQGADARESRIAALDDAEQLLVEYEPASH